MNANRDDAAAKNESFITALAIALIAVAAGAWFAYYRPARPEITLPQEASLYYPDADSSSILIELIIENTGARAAKIDTISLAWDYAPSGLAILETQEFAATLETQEDPSSQNFVPFKAILLKGGDVYRRHILFTENQSDHPRPFSARKHLCELTLHGNSKELSEDDFTLELTLDSQHRLEDTTGKTSLSVQITPVPH
jgi:hypothetical protein